MIKALLSRLKQGYRTYPFPAKEPVMPERFRGRPTLRQGGCSRCGVCVKVCPAGAVTLPEGRLALDMGKCLFCGECAKACPAGVIEFSKDYRLAASSRSDLVLTGQEAKLAQALDRQSRRIFGRSLKLRQVSAGGCNACEADTNVLSTLTFDLARFGVQFVASPRHADGILVTGPVTANMRSAVEATYAAVPTPKFVIAVGACAISGGPYAGHVESCDGVDKLLPVDLHVPGCPPHPYTILDALVTFLGRRG